MLLKWAQMHKKEVDFIRKHTYTGMYTNMADTRVGAGTKT